METAVHFTETVLCACRRLGRARLLLRNALGFAEVFGDLERLHLEDGWAHWRDERAHLHVFCAAIAGVRFLEAGAACRHQTHPTVCFHDAQGRPQVLIILDQTRGVDAVEQEHRFEDLRDWFGEGCALLSMRSVAARAATN